MLDAALELFIDKGVDAVKIDTAAKLSGVTRATVYRRYPRREDLVIAAIAEGYRAHLDHPSPTDPTVGDMIEGIAGALADPRVRGLLRRLMSVPHDHPELFARYRRETGAHDRDQVIRTVLAKEAATGGFPPGTDLEMVQVLFAGSISSHLLTHPDHESLDQVADYLHRALRTLGLEHDDPTAASPVTDPTKES